MPSEREWTINGRITEAGIRALGSARSNSVQVTFTHIILGRVAYGPEVNEIPQEHQIAKVEIADADWHNGYLNITANIDLKEEFDVGAIGVVVDNNTLFSIISKQGKVLTRKVKTEQLLISFDIHFRDLPHELVNIKAPEQRLSLSYSGELAQIAAIFTRQSEEIMELRQEIAAIRQQLAGAR